MKTSIPTQLLLEVLAKLPDVDSIPAEELHIPILIRGSVYNLQFKKNNSLRSWDLLFTIESKFSLADHMN